MAKKCLVLIFILVYCINLFLPILSFAQVVEGSSFYNYLQNRVNSNTSTILDTIDVYYDIYNYMVNSDEYKNLINNNSTYIYHYAFPISGTVDKQIQFIISDKPLYLSYYKPYSSLSTDLYTYAKETTNYKYLNSVYNISDDRYFNNVYDSVKTKTNGYVLSIDIFYGSTNAKNFLFNNVEDYSKLILNTSDLYYIDANGNESLAFTKNADIPTPNPPFDDSGIDWSSLFHYYVSTKGDVIPENRDIPVGEYNNKDYYMQNDLIFWWDGFEGMFSNHGNTDEDYMLNYLPNLQYTYIFTDLDGNTARLHSGWLGPLEYNTLHEQNLMFLADPNGDLSKVEPLYNILTAIVFNAKDFWIDTVIGDKTIQEFKDDNAIKDYINNKVEAIWDEKGYLDFTLEVEVKIDKQDLTATDNIHTCVWYDTFNVYFNRDNDFTVQPDDSYYVFNSDDIDIVYKPDGTIDKIFINNDNIESETLENGDTVFRDKTTGDIIYTATKDNDGNPIVKDGNDNVVWQPDNSDGFDRVLDNLEASGFDITGITEEMYEKTEHLTKNYSGVFSIFSDIFSWLPFDIDTLIFIAIVLLIIFKVFNRLGG